MHNDITSMAYDQQLFERFCKKDPRAGIEMINVYGKRLLQYIRRSCVYNDLEGAEDCLQSTWIKLLKHCGKALPEAGLWAVMCTMAKTQALDDHRKYERKKRMPAQTLLSLTQDDASELALADDSPNPEEWLMLLEAALVDEAKLVTFKQAFAALPDKQQQALHLQITESLSIKAIAERMQEKHETVRSHLRYAKEKLKRAL